MFKYALAGAFVFLTIGCLQPEGPGGTRDSKVLTPKEPDKFAGATSSTNWPSEDAGTQPIQVFGTVDSSLVLRFKQSPGPGEDWIPVKVQISIRIYEAGYIPIFDSVPSLKLDFPLADSIRLDPAVLDTWMGTSIDTISFSMIVLVNDSSGFIPTLQYSKKQKKFLKWPLTINSFTPTLISDPHYKFAGHPNAEFTALLADTQGNPNFYYYIPGSPYFWRNSFTDTLFIGPIPNGNFPLRLLKVMTEMGPKKESKVECFAITLKNEGSRKTYYVGEKIFELKAGGDLDIRIP